MARTSAIGWVVVVDVNDGRASWIAVVDVVGTAIFPEVDGEPRRVAAHPPSARATVTETNPQQAQREQIPPKPLGMKRV
jgi:hypothetical protein